MIWEPNRECLQRDELRQLQLESLQAVLARVYLHVPFYRKQFDAAHIDPDDFRNLSDLGRLPFTSKADLENNYPYGLFAVPLRDVVRIHASNCMSTVIGYTKNDIKTWSNLVARVLASGGVTKDDVVQIAYGYNLSTGGFGVHYGAERIGASVIPTSTGNTARQIKIMRDFKTTAFIATPSYALHVANTIEQQGLSPNALSLKYGLFGGEPWSENVRKQIQDRLRITTTDNYGLSEVIGPGVASECSEQCGLHINEDHFLAEIVDPQTMMPVREGEQGELVITTLTKEAFPVVRFRTRDLTNFIPGPCACGRKTIRMARVERRTDDVLIIRGIKLFPVQVSAVLKKVEDPVPAHQIVVERNGALDEVTLLLAPSESLNFDEVKQQQTRLQTIGRQLARELGLSMNIKLVERKSLDMAHPVVDKRKKHS